MNSTLFQATLSSRILFDGQVDDMAEMLQSSILIYRDIVILQENGLSIAKDYTIAHLISPFVKIWAHLVHIKRLIEWLICPGKVIS